MIPDESVQRFYRLARIVGTLKSAHAALDVVRAEMGAFSHLYRDSYGDEVDRRLKEVDEHIQSIDSLIGYISDASGELTQASPEQYRASGRLVYDVSGRVAAQCSGEEIARVIAEDLNKRAAR